MSEIQSSALAQALADKPQDAALEQALQRPYQHGFVTDIESESLPPGLNEDTIRSISRIKREPQFLLDWRLAAFKRWQAMPTPEWAHLRIAPIDLQALSYYSAPKSLKDKPKSLDEVDPKLLETYEKLNVPLHELWSRVDAVPAGEVWVHCAGGYRASVAASMLDAHGRRTVAIDDSFDNAQTVGLHLEGPDAVEAVA